MPNPPIELDAFTQGLVDGPDNAYGMSYEDMANEYADTMKGMAEFVVPTTPEDLAMTIATGPVGGKVVGKLPLPKSSKQLRKLYEQLQDSAKQYWKKNGGNSVFPHGQQMDEVWQALRGAEWDELFKGKKDKWSGMSYEDLLKEEAKLLEEVKAKGQAGGRFSYGQFTGLKKALWDAQDEAVKAGRVTVKPAWKGTLFGQKDTIVNEFPVGSRVRFHESQQITPDAWDSAAKQYDEGFVVGNSIIEEPNLATGEREFVMGPIIQFNDGTKAKFHPSFVKEFFPGLKPIK